jgi:hypothetical protein
MTIVLLQEWLTNILYDHVQESGLCHPGKMLFHKHKHILSHMLLKKNICSLDGVETFPSLCIWRILRKIVTCFFVESHFIMADFLLDRIFFLHCNYYNCRSLQVQLKVAHKKMMDLRNASLGPGYMPVLDQDICQSTSQHTIFANSLLPHMLIAKGELL